MVARNFQRSRVFLLNRGSARRITMKRAIAGFFLLLGMCAAPAFAGGRGLHRDIHHDERKIAHDRRELRHDLRDGNYAAARHERRELRREYRDLNRDRRDLYWDQR
jgi:hypothetical protein